MSGTIRGAAAIGAAALTTLVAGAASILPAGAQEILYETPGVSGELREDIQAASLLEAARAEGITDPQELLAAARADYGRIVGALYAEGRYGGVVNILVDGREAAAIPPLTRLPGIQRITVRVQPGPVYEFANARIAPLAPGTELPETFAPGQPAASPVIRDAAEAAVAGWRETGHAKADIAGQRAVARHERDALDVDITMAPGPLVRFGDLILRGGDSVRPARLRKIAGLPTGETFSPAELDQAATRLRRTQVFSSVALTEAEALGPGNRMDITARLVEQKPRRFGFGAEISSVEGLTLSGFWLHRNLLGGAERFRVEGEIASIGGGTGGTDYSFAVTYGRPATLGPDTSLNVTLGLEQLNEPDFSSRTATFGAGLTRILSEELTVEGGFAFRYSRITDDLGTAEYTLLTFPFGLTFDNRDQPLDATEGYYVDLDATPFVGFSDTDSGARLTWDARTYYGFGAEDRVVLAGRVQGGSILGAALDGVPNDYRFYSGGGGTVRGQDYQSLGVTLNGAKSGGASFVGLSAEIRAEVTDSIGIVAFADWGHVGSESLPLDGGDSHAGAGLGLRYGTPIGPIRLDVAAPVGGGASGFDVYVGIGQAF